MKNTMSMVEALDALKRKDTREVLMKLSKVRIRRVANELGLDIPSRVWRMRKNEVVTSVMRAMLVFQTRPLNCEKDLVGVHDGKLCVWAGWPTGVIFTWPSDMKEVGATPWRPLTDDEVAAFEAWEREESRKKEEEKIQREKERIESDKRIEMFRSAIISALDAEERRRGAPILTGDDDIDYFEPTLDANDAYHETGANTPG